MKKILCLIFLSIFCLPGIANAAFTDVKEYKEEIQFLVDEGIVQEQGEFRPNDQITRLEAVSMLMRSLEVDYTNVKNPNFSDVGESDVGYPYIASALELGIISGKTDKNGNAIFESNAVLTRAQMAKIIVNAFSLKKQYNKTFRDVPVTNPQAAFISILASNNITTGYNDGSFKPNIPLTRIHFAVFLARVLEPSYQMDNSLPEIPLSIGFDAQKQEFLIAALSISGNVIKWNSGIETGVDRYIKTYTQLSKNVKELENGYILKKDGTVWEINDEYTGAKQIKSLSNIETIASGGAFVAALTKSGELYIYDRHDFLKLGTNEDSPIKKLTPSNVKQIEAGSKVLFVLQKDGSVQSIGQLNQWADQQDELVKLPFAQVVTQIAVNDSDMYAFLTDDNDVFVSNNRLIVDGDFLAMKTNIGFMRVSSISNVQHIYSSGPSFLFNTKEDKYFQLSDGTHLTEDGPEVYKRTKPTNAIAVGNPVSMTNGGELFWLLSDGRLYVDLDSQYIENYYIPKLKNTLN
ncbi:S-layer homology domain-containing protein [Psychrobacillus psychrotolerans]|uniref:S-layer homology domain-containing protein n=1 Tax=Psychrobacillus psychrotolerans TaxID=126156 RepID=UPI003B02E704